MTLLIYCPIKLTRISSSVSLQNMLFVRSAATPDCRNFIPFPFPYYAANYWPRLPEFKNDEVFVLAKIHKSDETDWVIL